MEKFFSINRKEKIQKHKKPNNPQKDKNTHPKHPKGFLLGVKIVLFKYG